ncbi:hypothetical protein [Symbiopectobacterium sp. RP]|uniref:hypothetical protein n=1 Tax=Symbiopectobacterium sp. RP TaxID=3248553 RepID=UPI003D29B74B
MILRCEDLSFHLGCSIKYVYSTKPQLSINGHKQKQKKREWLRYRDFVLSPYGVIKTKSLGYID